MLRFWRYFQLLGRPMLRHGVFMLFMVILMWVTYTIVGEPHTKNLSFYIFQFLFDLYAFCGLLCVMERLGRRRKGWRVAARVAKYAFYTISYAACFIEAFIYMRFYLAFSPTMLNLVMETNGGESTEFVRSCLQSPKFMEAVRIYAAILGGNVFCGLFGHRLYRWTTRRLLRGRGKTILADQTTNLMAWCKRKVARFLQALLFPLAATLLLATTIVPWVEEKWKMLDYMMIEETTEAEKITGNVFYSPFLRIVYSYKFVKVVQKDTERLIHRMEDASLLSTALPDSMKRVQRNLPNIVLVIGESYNKHHASCYGYSQPTTPYANQMARTGALVVFDDAVTPWNITSNAFKSFLSTHSTDQPGAWTDGVLFPSIFHRAGYKVAFITNQFYKSKRQNRSDFNGSFFLNDPRLDSLCFDYRNSHHYRHDGGLLQELKRYDEAERNLYIVHFMGQHVLYKERCPDSERYFTTADYDRHDLTEDEVQIVADYDNATRYNDKVFGQLTTLFRKKDAIVIYLADHGDEVYDDGIGMFGRNHTATLTPQVLRGEFEVPMMVWMSQRFRRLHPDVAKRVKDAAHLPFSTDDLPHLLLGLTNIATPYYNAQRDLFSPTFNPGRKRPIKDTANYDDIIQK